MAETAMKEMTTMSTRTTSLNTMLRRFLTGLALALLGCAGLAALGAPSASANLEIASFDGGSVNEDGSANLAAGQHPFGAETSFTFPLEEDPIFGPVPIEDVKDTVVELPPGFLGNPQAAPECPLLERCSPESQIGTISVSFAGTGGLPTNYPLYNLRPPRGKAALLGFMYAGNPTYIEASVRSGDDYGIVATTRKIKQILLINAVSVTLWGVPGDPSHDRIRGVECYGELDDPSACSGGVPVIGPPRPFFTNPTRCAGPLVTSLSVDSWQNQGAYTRASFLSHDRAEPPNQAGITGCDQLEFNPTIEAKPTTNLADSPSGLDFNLHIPQNEDPYGSATAHLRDATVKLPAGMTVNPSSANGLGACSPAQVGLITPVGQTPARFTPGAANCPNDSKLGTVSIETPVLDHPLAGEVFLASQNENPFGSLLALYIAIDDAKSGVVVKLPGKVEPDPQTGQLTASFAENPQLPFEDLALSFFGGPRGSLKTPLQCGTHTSSSTMVPWSAPEGASAFPASSFQIARGANDGACVGSEAQAPNRPAFSAGTADPAAGSYSPFTLRIARPDGSQQIKGIDTTLPPGLVGKLAGVPYCSDANLAVAAGRSGKDEQASSSCPSASQVGSVNVGAGAGSQPLYVSGKAYLAGPYKGAPLSLAIITPAVAGPFDLGTVVVRAALQVNPETAQIRAVSDPIPTILQGIPLDVRSIVVSADRPSFTLNPTSCNPMAVNASATSLTDQSASLSSPFQVGGCAALGFKPKLALKLKGGTKRGQYPALRATLTTRPGDANIAKAIVSLPHSAFLAQEHIKTICTRVQFAANSCPPGSVYGKATAWSPLLDQPLSGPVYLRSSSNKLPDLVVDLNGQIRVSLAGRIDSDKKGGIRNSFELVPDAPVSKFVLEMQGGKKGLLVNSRDICKSTSKADVKVDGQNGKAWDSRPVLTNDCGKKAKKKGGGEKKSGKKKR